jgi:DNA-binding NarL/FixJ family response regulator
MIRIAITDDHPVVQDGLQRIIELQQNMCVTDVYANARQLLLGLQKRQPDVLLLDLQLPDTGGEEIVPSIRKTYPEMKIIMLTANSNVHSIKMMMNLGAKAYLLKNSDQALLVKAIEEVYRGGIFVSENVQQKLNEALLQSRSEMTAVNELTNREKEILRLIAQEKNSKEIGELLHIGYRTVENYRTLIMQKLGVKNMVGMVKKAIFLNLLED